VAIVFKDLQKLVSKSQQENITKELFQRLQGKPFWIWDNSSTSKKISEQKGIAVLILILLFIEMDKANLLVIVL
jgi:hypothetical protein